MGFQVKLSLGPEVAHDLEGTAGQPDAELVDGPAPWPLDRRRPDDRRSDVGDSRGGFGQGDGQEAAILQWRAVGPMPPGATNRGAPGRGPRARRRHESPHGKDSASRDDSSGGTASGASAAEWSSCAQITERKQGSGPIPDEPGRPWRKWRPALSLKRRADVEFRTGRIVSGYR